MANQRIRSQLDQKVTNIRMFKQIQKRVIDTMSCAQAFQKLDTENVGYLTLRDFQLGFSKHFDLSLKASEVRALFMEIDSDENGIIKFLEFECFYQEDYNQRAAALNRERSSIVAQNEIFDHLMKVLRQRGLTLQQVFEQIDDDKNNYIEVDEFHDMLERMGFTITQEQVYDLMRIMDDNFDGRISYAELRQHIESLGFDIAKIEGENTEQQISALNQSVEFRWRDKALELILRTLKKKVGSTNYQSYFSKYDADHDKHLTP